jgi:hypothetical protein
VSGKATRPVEERFWEKVDMSGGPDACWPWTGAVVHGGYGDFSIGAARKHNRAHRVAHWLVNGVWPGEMHVLHSCDNPPCCNPAHLSLGTRQENARQMAERKRSTFGAKNPNAKINEKQMLEIRRRRKAGEKLRAIAGDYGICISAVSRIADGTRWVRS